MLIIDGTKLEVYKRAQWRAGVSDSDLELFLKWITTNDTTWHEHPVLRTIALKMLEAQGDLVEEIRERDRKLQEECMRRWGKGE